MADNIDYGPRPCAMNIEEETLANDTFRTTKWTGQYLQMTVMSIEPGDEVGLEKHDDHDQFLRIEEGEARVVMGAREDNLDQEWLVEGEWGIFVPAGTWHNIINTGAQALKLYSIYAPGEHPHSTVHQTRQESE